MLGSVICWVSLKGNNSVVLVWVVILMSVLLVVWGCIEKWYCCVVSWLFVCFVDWVCIDVGVVRLFEVSNRIREVFV